MNGVSSVSNLHIWQLEGDRIIATAHIGCHDPEEYMELARNIKTLFHDHGIHSTTMQPDFVGVKRLLNLYIHHRSLYKNVSVKKAYPDLFIFELLFSCIYIYITVKPPLAFPLYFTYSCDTVKFVQFCSRHSVAWAGHASLGSSFKSLYWFVWTCRFLDMGRHISYVLVHVLY